MRTLPARLLWEHLVLPRQIRFFAPNIVFSPFNVAPTVWPRPRPRIAVMVSNLGPYAQPVISRCRPQERVRNAVLRRLTNRTLARADRVFVLSRQAFSLIRPSLLSGKTEVVPHAPPAVSGAVDGASASAPAEPFFVVVGDLYKFKGVEQVIRALALLEEQPRPLVLVCGRHLESDYVRAITTEADRLGVGERIRLPGSLPYGELLSLLASARACIAPSRFENLSRVPWEAMSVDTPVIASDIPAFREACGDAALYFGLDRPDELAGHMRAVLAGREPRESLLASARRRLGGTPSTQASAQLLSSLEQLVS